MSASPTPGRVLVAGIGNIFLNDDGFGVETLRSLTAGELPDHVEAVDFGVRGVHLAYQVLEGYHTLILVDAAARGGPPGTVYLIEPEAGPVESAADEPLLDGHRMGPDAVLALLGTLAAGTGTEPPARILVVGCEPASLDEGIGLSPAVAAAVGEAAALVRRLLHGDVPTPDPPRGDASAADTEADRKAAPC
jgi:hydrogenase maturation protease